MADEAATAQDKAPDKPPEQQPIAVPPVDVNAAAPKTDSDVGAYLGRQQESFLQPFGKELGKGKPPPLGMEDLDQAARDYVGKNAQVAGELSGYMEKNRDLYTRMGQLPHPALPKLQDIPQTPRLQMRSSLQAFQNPLMWLAFAGSLLTRQPVLNAMGAATGLMEGFTAGDNERIALEQQRFKNSVDRAVHQNSTEVARYKLAMSDHDLSAEDLMNQVRMNAAEFKDKTLLSELQKGNFDAVFKVIDLKEKLNEKLLEAQLKWDRINSVQSQKANKQSEADSFQRQRVDNYVQTIDSAIEKLRAAKGRTVPQVGSLAGASKLYQQVAGGDTLIADLQRDLANLKDQYGQVFARKGRTLSSEMKNLDTIIPGSITQFNVGLAHGFAWPSLTRISEVENALNDLKQRIQTQYGDLTKGEAPQESKSPADMSDEELLEEYSKRGMH